MNFLLETKVSHESTNFDTFKCFDENLPNSSCHFPNHKSVFLQILHDSSVSWKITPLYFFSWNSYILRIKGTNQSTNFLDFWVLGSKFTKLLSFLKQQIGFSSNFISLFSTMRHNCTFLAEFYILSTKWAYQSTNLVKFHLSSQKSEILHFDDLLL